MKNLNCFSCCSKNSECCICSEPTSKGFKCKLCKEGFVCRKCMPRLCESGLCNKCPVCRQVDWRKKNTSQTVVIPIKESDIIIVEPVTQSQEEIKPCLNELPSCRYTMDKLLVLFSILFLSYIIGIFTVAEPIKYPYSRWRPEHHILAFVVGIFEFCIISYCCWRSLCYPRGDRLN